MSDNARFTINATPSEDVDGNRVYEATNSEQLAVTLEANPSIALSVRYEVFDPSDPESPLASKDAPNLTWNESSAPAVLFQTVQSTATIDMPGAGSHSYLIRCTVSTDAGDEVFERIVLIRTTTTVPALRKTVPAESIEAFVRAWSDSINEIVDAIANGGGSPTAPGGANTNVQYNNAGAFGGDANFTWNSGTQTLDISGDINATNFNGVPLTTAGDGLSFLASDGLYKVPSGTGSFLVLGDTINSYAGQRGTVQTVNAGETALVAEVLNRSTSGVTWDPTIAASEPENSLYKTWAEAFAAAMTHPGVPTIVLTANGTVTYSIDGGVQYDCESRLILYQPVHPPGGNSLVIQENTELLNPLAIVHRGDEVLRLNCSMSLDSANSAGIVITGNHGLWIEGVRMSNNGTRPFILFQSGSSQKLFIGSNVQFDTTDAVQATASFEVHLKGWNPSIAGNTFLNSNGAHTLTFRIEHGQIIGSPSDYTTSWAGTVSFSFEHDAFYTGYGPTTTDDWSPVPSEVGTALDQLASTRVHRPSSGTSLDNSIARWDGADATFIQDSLITINDSGHLDLEEHAVLAQRRTAISPTAIAAIANDYDPTGFGTCDIVRITLTGSQTVTGFAAPVAGENEAHYIVNFDSTDILLLANESVNSSAANRMTTPNGEDVKLGPAEVALILYDFTTSRWIVLKLNGQLHYAQTAWFDEQYDNGNTGASQTVTWANGQKQRSELNAATVTVTHTFPGVGNYIWNVEQDATTQCTSLTIAVTGGSAFFPDAELRIGAGASSRTLVAIYYDGTNAWFTSAPNMATGSVLFV